MGGRARGAVPVVEERCGEDSGVRGGMVWRCILQGVYFIIEVP
jgi:hypothetical protein